MTVLSDDRRLLFELERRLDNLEKPEIPDVQTPPPDDDILTAFTTGMAVIQSFMALTGFWPMTSAIAQENITEAYQHVTDVSGNVTHLSFDTTHTPVIHHANGFPVMDCRSGGYLEASNSRLRNSCIVTHTIDAGVTVGVLARLQEGAASFNTLIGVRGNATANREVYLIHRRDLATGIFDAEVRGEDSAGDPAHMYARMENVQIDVWTLYIARFQIAAQSRITLFVGQDTLQRVDVTDNVLARVNVTTIPFRVGAGGDDASTMAYQPGEYALPFYVASAVPDEQIERLYDAVRPILVA